MLPTQSTTCGSTTRCEACIHNTSADCEPYELKQKYCCNIAMFNIDQQAADPIKPEREAWPHGEGHDRCARACIALLLQVDAVRCEQSKMFDDWHEKYQMITEG